MSILYLFLFCLFLFYKLIFQIIILYFVFILHFIIIMIVSSQKKLIELIENKNLNEIRRIFEEDEIIIENINDFSKTLLYLIKEKISLDIVKYLINQQKKIRVTSKYR